MCLAVSRATRLHLCACASGVLCVTMAVGALAFAFRLLARNERTLYFVQVYWMHATER